MAAVFPDQWFGGDHDTRAGTVGTRDSLIPRPRRFCHNSSRRRLAAWPDQNRSGGNGVPHGRSPDSWNQPNRHAQWDRLPGVPSRRRPRLVAASSPLRPVRPHRLLRLIARTARECPRAHRRSPCREVLRAWRELVLRAHHTEVLSRPAAAGSSIQASGTAVTRTARQGTGRLAGTPPPVGKCMFRTNNLDGGIRRGRLVRL
jgi:hypothetical protein